MHFTRHVSRALDEEHRASLDLLERLERGVMHGADTDLAGLGLALRQWIDDEVALHFGFEEGALFPRLHDAGDGDIAELLAQEHADIRELCAELHPLAVALAGGGLAPAERGLFERLVRELVERVVAHIQKETMALLPLLEDLLDDDTDRQLALARAGSG